MEVGAGEITALDQAVQPVEVALQLIGGFVQSGFDQAVDAHVAPSGQQLAAQAVEVIGRALNRWV